MDTQEIRDTVSTLMDCLVREQPGLSCAMAQRFMSVSYRDILGTTAVEHYTSIFTFDDRRQARHTYLCCSIPLKRPSIAGSAIRNTEKHRELPLQFYGQQISRRDIEYTFAKGL